MSSCASDRVRAQRAALLVALVGASSWVGCARPAPIRREVDFAPSCRFGERDDLLLASVQVEVWAAPASTSCGVCRSGRASCTLLASRCVTLAGPTPVGSIDVALAGMELPATADAVCVMVIGLSEATCSGLPCEGRCDDVAYCASSRASLGDIAVGVLPTLDGAPSEPAQVCSSEFATARQAMERCLFGAELLDAGVPASTDAGVPDAPRPFDALVPRDGAAGENARLARDVGPVPDGARPFGS